MRWPAFAPALAAALAAAQCLTTPAAADDKTPRIVSLGGSVSEIVAALGAADLLVARDTTTNYPESLLALPDVGYIRALSPEGVLSVAPDLILAEAGAGPLETIEVLRAAGVPFVPIPEDFTARGVLAKIDAVAAAIDRPTQGAALAAEVGRGLDQAQAHAAEVTAPKRVLFVLSLQGGRVMAGGQGTAAEGILRLAGAQNAASGFDGYKLMTDEAVLTAAPDAILMMDREGDLAIADADVLAHPALSATPAAASGQIIRMDGMLLLGFGPRTPQAAAALHAALYGTGG
ncbi:MAG TPA: ABC transporter substrate-binding protein [Paracoccaceae bacterium]